MNSINIKTNLKFDDDFFKEEIRCDYIITEKTKKIWAVELDLLNELLRVCKKYDIKIFVFAGTLLGAIRHKGFIPWDDDIDVCLVREEYEKLLKVAPSEFSHPYFFQNALTDRRYFIGFSRLRNSLTTGHVVGQDSNDYNQGIYLDIFVLDGYINDKLKLKRQLFCRTCIYQLISSYHLNIGSNNKVKRLIKEIMTFLLKYSLCRIIPYEKAVDWYQQNQQRYNKMSSRVALLTHEIAFIRKYWCKKEDLEDVIEMPFENIKVPVPRNYDVMLKNMYGNYMEYPPIEKRGLWHQNKIVFDPDTPYLSK